MQIVVANIKGGCGKSTLVASLADVLGEEKVDIIDHDNQGTIKMHATFTNRLKPVTASSVTKKILLHDTPPLNSEGTRSLLRAADLILIPAKVKTPDLLATKGIVDVLRQLKLTGMARIVFTDVRKPHNSAYRAVKKIFQENYTDVVKCTTELSSLVSFAKVFTDALYGQARKEVNALMNELKIV